MKEFDVMHGKAKVKKKQINDNWYYLIVGPEPESNTDKYVVFVHAYKDGREMDYIKPFDSHKFDITTKFIENKSKVTKSFVSIISNTLNETICKLEQKQEDSEELNSKINAALEANKEIHES